MCACNLTKKKKREKNKRKKQAKETDKGCGMDGSL